MPQLWTFPTQDVLHKLQADAEEYRHPNTVPCAVVAEGLLLAEQCDSIVERCNTFPGYNYGGCNAVTREIGHIPELDSLRDFGHSINRSFWGYDLDPDTVTWMQTYSDDADYQLHMDARPGQMRKLTAVVFLTDPNQYEGGELEVFYHPNSKVIPRTQGTVVCFQPWILHKVSPVTRGLRQTLNVSYWGPNFK